MKLHILSCKSADLIRLALIDEDGGDAPSQENVSLIYPNQTENEDEGDFQSDLEDYLLEGKLCKQGNQYQACHTWINLSRLCAGRERLRILQEKLEKQNQEKMDLSVFLTQLKVQLCEFALCGLP